MRNLLFSAVFAAASLFGAAAHADDIQAGKQYTELSSPVPVSEPGKIEVVELFWYGCPHCYAFEPTLNAWSKKLPDDVAFKRVPAMFGGIWNVHGQLFVTLEAMGVEAKVHDAVFAAIHKEHKKLATPEEMADFLATQGVDRDKFLSTYNSFAVKGQVEKDKKLAMAYQITGVPTMVINGKYRFDLGAGGGPYEPLTVAYFLTQKERAPMYAFPAAAPRGGGSSARPSQAASGRPAQTFPETADTLATIKSAGRPVVPACWPPSSLWSGRMERADVERWKSKYLESLENLERLESRWENRLDLVRRGLVRSSLAAEGNDAAVDACLVELRDILRRDDSDADLAKLIPRLERTVLDSEQRRELRARQVAEAFAELCRLLQTLELPRDQRKALKGFAKRAQAAADQPGELPALLGEFSRLQQQALSQLHPEQPARAGFLQRLLGGRGEAAEEAPATTSSPLATDASPAPAAEALATSESPPLPVEGIAAAPSEPPVEPLAVQADPAYALPPVPEPGYSAIAPHLEATLLRLLDDLSLPDSHKPQAEHLRQRIQGSLNWYELVPVLDDLSVLVLALNHSGQSEFQLYLRRLNERLAAFQTGLQDVHVGRQDGQTQERAFGDALRGQVNELQNEVQEATDLDSLKLSLDSRLEGLLASLADQQSQRETREQEANERLSALTERVAGMEREAQQYRGHLEEQRQKALCDPLTGLPNRAAWSERLELEVARWQRHGGDLLLAVLDVDLFKRINDGYGHLAGDKVLKIIASELQRRLRKTDFIARFGGEEFVMLLGATPLAGGVTLIEQLRAAVAACPFHFKGERVVITLSAGLAAFAPGEDADTVFERADQALYRAKRAGRDRLDVA